VSLVYSIQQLTLFSNSYFSPFLPLPHFFLTSSFLLYSACAQDDGNLTVFRRDHTASFPEDRWTTKGIVFKSMVSEYGFNIKSLSWDPKNEFLAVGFQNGDVSILDTAGLLFRQVAYITAAKSMDASVPIDSVIELPFAWHPSGSILAIASDADVSIYERSTLFTKAYPISPPSAIVATSTSSNALCWSPNGRFLSSADSARGLTIWDFSSIGDSPDRPLLVNIMKIGGRVIGEDETPIDSAAAITFISWTQDGNTLAYSDFDGNIGAAKMKFLTKASGSAIEPLKTPFSWPIKSDTVIVEDTITTAATTEQGETTQLQDQDITNDTNETEKVKVIAPTTTAAVASSATTKKQLTLVASKFVDEVTLSQQLPSHDDLALLALQQQTTTHDGQNNLLRSIAPVKGAVEVGAREEDDDNDTLLTQKRVEVRETTTTAIDFDANEANLTLEKNNLGFKDAEDGISGLVPFSRPLLGERESVRNVEFTADDFRKMLKAEMRLILSSVDKQHGLLQPQAAFQSGSTPFIGSSRRSPRRYLAWNSIGSITSRKEPGQNIIDVDFTDAQMHRAMHFTDMYGFTLATLNESGVLYASPFIPSDSGNDGQAGLLKFVPIGSHYGIGNEWVLHFTVNNIRALSSNLPKKTGLSVSTFIKTKMKALALQAADEMDIVNEDEEKDEDQDEDSKGENDEVEIDTSSIAESPVAVALGDGFAVAATDRQMLRFIRTGGIQDAVMLVPGAVVTVAAKGALCAVAYHRSTPSENTQRISVDVYIYTPISFSSSSITSFSSLSSSTTPADPAASFTGAPRLLRTVDLPLRPETMLQWFDFSSNGILMAHTTGGTLMALQPAQNWAWSAICDTTLAFGAGKKTKKISNDKCWPVHVSVCSSEALEQASAPGQASSFSSFHELSCMPKGAHVPLLHGCLLKGQQVHPNVSTPKPIVTPVALHVPLLECANVENATFDNSFVRSESLRAHRLWCESVGLSSEKGAVQTALHTAMTTAAANARGHVVLNTIEATKEVLRNSFFAGVEEEKALDRSVLRMVSAACNSRLDARATQLACRLNGVKAFNQATKMAGFTDRNAVNERIVQIMTVKKAAADAAAAQATSSKLQIPLATQAPVSIAPPTITTPPPQVSSSSSSSSLAPSTLPTTSNRSASSQAYSDAITSSNSAIMSNISAPIVVPITSSIASRPFAKKTSTLSSPTRNVNNKRGLESLAMESPARVGGGGGGGSSGISNAVIQPFLARSSSFATEERTKKKLKESKQ
jgi:hypothetical protein